MQKVPIEETHKSQLNYVKFQHENKKKIRNSGLPELFLSCKVLQNKNVRGRTQLAKIEFLKRNRFFTYQNMPVKKY